MDEWMVRQRKRLWVPRVEVAFDGFLAVLLRRLRGLPRPGAFLLAAAASSRSGTAPSTATTASFRRLADLQSQTTTTVRHAYD